MAGQTTHYQLIKPTSADDVLVTDLNTNADKIDAALHAKIDEPTVDGTSGQVLTTDGNGGRAWADVSEIDDTAGHGDTSVVWSAGKTYDTTTSLRRKINSMPKIAETEEDDADMYVADSNGNVVVKFVDGHIQTQNFDSSDVGDIEELETTDKTSIVDAINEINGKTHANVPIIELTDENDSFDITDSQGYSVARFKNGGIETKYFNSSLLPEFCEYMFSGTDILLAFGYNNTSDAVVVFNVGRANDLFDFKSFMLKPKGKPLNVCSQSEITTIWNTGTDMHSPFQFNVTSNADGYYSSSTDAGYTGGNHFVTINGTDVKCASSKYVYYFADGKPVTNGYGLFRNFEIKWANNVQAYNCVKADGTGRTSLIEYHDMIFDGVRFNEEIMLVPLEEIKVELWHGFQSVGWNGVYNHARFIDATNRQEFTPEDETINSGNNTTSGILQWGNEHGLEMRVDTTCDLGKRTYYSGTSGAFLSNSIHKGYFYIIKKDPTGFVIDADSAMYLRGSYRFYPFVN